MVIGTDMGSSFTEDWEVKVKKNMIKPADINGKQIKEIMNEDTIVLDKLREGWDNDVIRLTFNAGTVDDITVLYTEYYVFIFKESKLKTVFFVYDLHTAFLNKERGLITAVGHETMHEYWLDNGEYKCNYIR